jgi:hypothetical protein
MSINERRLRRLFAAEGFEIIRIRNNRHFVTTVQRAGGGPQFNVTSSRSPSDWRFERQFAQTLRRAEQAARDNRP